MSNYKGSNLRHAITGIFCSIAVSTVLLASATSTLPAGNIAYAAHAVA